MNSDHANIDESDVAVRAIYRELATEASPPDLDAGILREAARLPGEEQRNGWFRGAFKPLAFAATFALSLALMLQLGDSRPPGPAVDDTATSLSNNPMRDAATETGEQIRRIGAAPAGPSTTATSDDEVIPAAPVDRNSRLPANDDCSDAQRSDSGRWWQCIKDLERRGLSSAAEAELRALLAAHPGFAAPR